MGEPQLYELIIVGAGPAGLSAACAAQERGISYLVIERNGLVQSLVEHPQQIRYFSPSDELAIAGIPFPMAGGHKPTREDALAYYRSVAAARHLNLALWEEVLTAEPSNVADLTGLNDPDLQWDITGPVFLQQGDDDETTIDLPPNIEDADGDDGETNPGIAMFSGMEEMPADIVHGPVPGFRVITQKWTTGAQIERYCRFLMICSGTFQNPRMLGVPGANLPKVHSRLDDPTPYFGCDVLVVGGGNSAATAAMTLAEAGARVTLAMRREPVEFQSHLRPFIVRDLKIMADEGRLDLIKGVRLAGISPDHVTLVHVPYGQDHEDIGSPEITLPNDFVFGMIGHTADRRLFDAIGLPLADDGLPIYDEETAETQVPGIFVAGSLSRANLIIESRRRTVEVIERIQAELFADSAD